MSNLSEISSGLSIPHLGSGFTDVIAFVFDNPRETSINANAGNIDYKNILETSNFTFNLSQDSVSNEILTGAGPDSRIFSIGQISLSATAKTLLFQDESGWVSPIFDTLWDKTRLGWYGTASASVGNLVSNASIGTSVLVTDNISDFAGLPTPFNLYVLTTNETPETLSVSSVNKSERKLILSTTVSTTHTAINSTLSALPVNSDAPAREPSFSLISLREGMLSPCLISKLTIEANVGQDVEINIDFKALRIFRDRQIDLKDKVNNIIDNIFKYHSPNRIINGTNVKISLTSGLSGTFGLPTALGDQIFAGFQGLGIDDFTIIGVSFSIDNQMKEIYTSHSINRNVQLRRRENSYPFALASEGRKITGKIKYKSSIDFWKVMERLAGPSSINGGGIIIDFGAFKITMPEIAWQPSTSSSNMQSVEREINFTMISETVNAMPIIEFSNQV